MAAQPNSFPGFERVTEQIWLQRGAAAATDDEKAAAREQPTMILLFGWGDAQPRHVAKYVDGFRGLYKQADMVVVLSPILQAVRQGVDERTRSMQPLVDLVGDDAEQRLLIHAMSNGGGMFYAAAINAYAQAQTTQKTQNSTSTLPHKLLSLDSAPGGDKFWANLGRWSRAMAIGIAPTLPWPFAVTQFLCASALGTVRLLECLLGRTSAATFSRYAANDSTLESLDAHRLYLYSKEDDIIGWEDVVSHAADARRLGYTVETEVFVGSPHVGHMRQHPQQYWGAIGRAWTTAMSR